MSKSLLDYIHPLPESEKRLEYVMGIDPLGYDGETGTCIIMSRNSSTQPPITKIEAHISTRNKEYYKYEVERLMALYKVEKIFEQL